MFEGTSQFSIPPLFGLGSFKFISTETPGQRPFGLDTPHILPASSVRGQMAGSETDRFLAKLREEQQKLLQQNRQNVRNSSARPPKMVATANCFEENSNDNHDHLMKRSET